MVTRSEDVAHLTSADVENGTLQEIAFVLSP